MARTTRSRPPSKPELLPLSKLVRVKNSGIDGRGIFARQPIPAGTKIGELAGELITQREARRRARLLQRIAIVELDNGMAIDASVDGNEFRYINHNCEPNVRMRAYVHRCSFFARRDIQRGEELVCDYGETHHDGKLPCRCGATNCRGFL